MISHNIITIHQIKAKLFGGKTYSSINISTSPRPEFCPDNKAMYGESGHLWCVLCTGISLPLWWNRRCGYNIVRWKPLPFALQAVLCKVLTWPTMPTYFNETRSCLKWNLSSPHSLPLINLALAFKRDCIPLGISDGLGNFICLIYILFNDFRRQLLFNARSSNVHVSWLELIFLFSSCFHELNLLKYENQGEQVHMSNTVQPCFPLSTQR